MKHKLEYIKDDDLKEYDFWWDTKDGKHINLPYYWGHKLDLENDAWYNEDDDVTFPDINELASKSLLFPRYGYKIVDLDLDDEYEDRYDFKRPNFKEWAAFFRDNGINVTIDALRHNFCAWSSGFKSGYRDEKNGYHLFTPCGGNPLSFRATTLHSKCSYWQITYEC